MQGEHYKKLREYKMSLFDMQDKESITQHFPKLKLI